MIDVIFHIPMIALTLYALTVIAWFCYSNIKGELSYD